MFRSMNIKSLTVAVLVLSSNVNSALIDNGGYTTDDVSGLDWLDLTFTTGVSYNDASLGFGTYEGGGWRYANNAEVETLFGILFDGYYDTNPAGYSDTQSGNAYGAQTSDMVSFFSLLGSWSYTVHTLNYGLYEDEAGLIRMIGAWCYTSSCQTSRNVVYGTNLTSVYDAQTNYSQPSYGTYLVRDNPNYISSVPVPAAIWLFGSGLLGLVGVARRKSA